jgi:hypothetical protein
VDHAVRPSSASICSSARRTAASPAAAAISLGGSLGSRSAGAEKGAGLTRFCRFTRTATANGSPVTLPLIICRLRRRCQGPASSDQSLHHLLDCRNDIIPRIGALDLCQIGNDSPLSNATVDDPLKARPGQSNSQVPNRRRIFRPWREVTSHSLFTLMAAEISRSLFGNVTSELISISAGLSARHRPAAPPPYTRPPARRALLLRSQSTKCRQPRRCVGLENFSARVGRLTAGIASPAVTGSCRSNAKTGLRGRGRD